MKIAWSPEAIEDLVSLRAYIADDNPAAARRTGLAARHSRPSQPPQPGARVANHVGGQ